ncbi:MAG: glycogen debranching N-terminal domain-containing protein [Thermomicrobium sp.]|nr:glycogen debranching N-terminal domain-containing protein [Thermomicrobium sp.]
MGLAREARILKDGELFVVSDERGDLRRTFPGAGVYARDTRFLSELWLLLNGEEPELFDSSAERTTTAVFEFGNPLFRDDAGHDVLAHTISLRRCRTVRRGTLEEELVLENYNPFPIAVELALVFAADFFDIFEVRGFPRERPRGHVLLPQHDGKRLLLAYRAPDDLLLETEILFSRPPDVFTTEPGTTHLADLALPRMLLPGHDQLVRAPRAVHPPRAFTLFRATLPVHGSERLSFRVVPRQLFERRGSVRIPDVSRLGESAEPPAISFARVRTDHEFLDRMVRRSLDDLRALVTPFPGGQLVAAGIPWFVAPFGRDSLIVSLQMMLFSPELARETLRFLARYQGRKLDPWTEEEPGKILHELRFGEMVRLGETPHSPYYGTVDATPLFVVTFCELMDWIGSPALFEELFPAVEAALRWIDEYGDHDRDGFVDYGKISPRGLVHQNWKDSHNSLLFLDGSEPVPPIAPVEVQGYVYQAKRALASVLQRYASTDYRMLAARLRAEAEHLRRLFEQRFWMEEQRFYGQAIDGQGRLVPAISSNPGHCLWSEIVSPERAALLVARLFAPDLYSGWGIRTLAKSMPHYNPMSYHNGSVWPHDNALIAAGLRRYGFDREAIQLASDLVEVAITFPYFRLPELFCGFGRDEAECMVPISYPVSCSPQAWAAGTVPYLLRILLGIEARAAERRLTLRPAFPDWLNEVEIEGISFAGTRLDLAVRRTNGRYVLEVECDPAISVVLAGTATKTRR